MTDASIKFVAELMFSSLFFGVVFVILALQLKLGFQLLPDWYLYGCGAVIWLALMFYRGPFLPMTASMMTLIVPPMILRELAHTLIASGSLSADQSFEQVIPDTARIAFSATALVLAILILVIESWKVRRRDVGLLKLGLTQ
jgi:hypothetical protein